MNKKRLIKLIIFILIVALTYFIFFNKSTNAEGMEDFMKKQQGMDFSNFSNSEGKGKSSKSDSLNLSQTAEIKSASIESVELHATYYLEEVYVSANEYVTAGTNILKYTNGTYLTAPYNCCIVELNVPEVGEKVTNSHYVKIESTNILEVSMKVSESNINKLSVGATAQIEVSALGKKYTGYVTHIGSTASNGKFAVTIEFENDGNIKLGMTSTVSITK